MLEKTVLEALDLHHRVLLNLISRDPISSDDLENLIKINKEIREQISSYEKKYDLDLEKVIATYLKKLQIPVNIKGYRYLKYAIILKIEKENDFQKITKDLYPAIASHFNTTSQNVEAAIRHAVEVSWNNGALNDVISCKPTNNFFISTIVEKIKMKL